MGYVIVVPHKRPQGFVWLLGAFGLTDVEQIAIGAEHPAFMPMFVTAFVFNTAFAFDAYQEVTERQAAAA